MLKRFNFSIATLLLVALSSGVIADDDDVLFNEVQLQARAEREIPNDEMLAVLVVEHQGKQPAEIAAKVNQDMDWALGKVKKVKEVSSKTGSYRTNPLYREGNIIGWQTSQELELKSQSVTDLTNLIGDLQEKLQVRQMVFVPTEETRSTHEDELIELAMEAFKRRVEIVRKHMDNKDYRIIRLMVNTSDQFAPPVMFGARARMATMAAEVSTPSVEAGTSKIVVTVDGSVQFF